jgi:L-amino acid N-acyltransferase YncA
MTVKLRSVMQKDWKFILELRNTPEIRTVCYDTSIINYETHEKYMKKLNSESNSHQWIIVDNDIDVGQAKIDDLVLGYMLKSDYTGRGIWSKAYSLVLEEAKKLGFKKLNGTVKFEQKKQLEIALKLGFIITGEVFRSNKSVGYAMEKNL